MRSRERGIASCDPKVVCTSVRGIRAWKLSTSKNGQVSTLNISRTLLVYWLRFIDDAVNSILSFTVPLYLKQSENHARSHEHLFLDCCASVFLL